jgi:hypothetical protein
MTYPETAGPWSAVSMSTISMNLVAHDGRPTNGTQLDYNRKTKTKRGAYGA